MDHFYMIDSIAPGISISLWPQNGHDKGGTDVTLLPPRQRNEIVYKGECSRKRLTDIYKANDSGDRSHHTPQLI
jgi:hypothetical protein